MFAQAFDNQFARDVRAGLTRTGQKTLPCRYFYDDVGSALFETITRLPEYGLSRADARILQTHAAELVSLLPPNLVVAELGSGSGAKTKPVLEVIGRRQLPVYYPIDVSGAALAQCETELAGVAAVVPLEAGYLDGLRRVVEQRDPRHKLLVLFLGSTIGNFEPEAAVDFLLAVRICLEPGDALLLGTDLVKPVDQMLLAYDDPAGVTAAFNKNLLARVNRELGADFDVRSFAHKVRYDAEAQRIEMHLRATGYQIVHVPAAELMVDFVPEETVCTEACHKFHTGQICTMARTAGFRIEAQWTDRDWPFAESLLIAA
jgi:L-histidine Nalpha-methyltransferase